MIKYIPFLKFKQNEIQGVAQLGSVVRDQIAPLYDVPRSQSVMTEVEILKRIRLAAAELKKSKDADSEYWFFVDNFDIDESINLAGSFQYRYMLDALKTYRLMPVVALDRSPDHNSAAFDFIRRKPGLVGVRLQETDIESYNITKPRLDLLWSEIQAAQPAGVVLLIDLRVIDDHVESKRKVERFLSRFRLDFQVNATSVSGSVIPGNIATLIGTDVQKHVVREEYRLWRTLTSSPDYQHILYGDYGVVSPEYSDLDLNPELMSGVSTPKVFYTHSDQFYISRGRRFKTHGYQQYFTISDDIVGQTFYRGAAYSYGDNYIHERSYLSARRPPKGGSPSTWIKSLTAAHITFIVNTI
ncbi:beta family protein [Pseudomonas protegens]|uniref:beta family protein n=1 Tax=Pseudomonas protegens TaxID=380021 RepID=UPI0018838642|nr:beta family protein [Pseudomonas protegens]MBF0642191.1 beta family protein [Pseudomonas protegens]MBP5119505.1 beta family protein [Pseudomonas protegens]QTU20513.1 beta family protein [Pseudomonas protegens]